jgi:hypothetical protein
MRAASLGRSPPIPWSLWSRDSRDLSLYVHGLIPFKSTITFYKEGIKDSESRIVPFKSNNKLVKKAY